MPCLDALGVSAYFRYWPVLVVAIPWAVAFVIPIALSTAGVIAQIDQLRLTNEHRRQREHAWLQ